MKRLKNNLDERQELELLRIEHYGMWFAFWALLAAMVIQAVMGAPMSQLAGEWIVFMLLCVGTLIACIRKGIWDRYFKPNFKTNLMLSIMAGIVVLMFTFVIIWHNVNGDPEFAGLIVICSLIPAAITFVLCLAALTLTLRMTKNRQQKLDEAVSDDEDDE